MSAVVKMGIQPVQTMVWIVEYIACFSVMATKKMCWPWLTVCPTCWPPPATTERSLCGTWCQVTSSVTCAHLPLKAMLTSHVSRGCVCDMGDTVSGGGGGGGGGGGCDVGDPVSGGLCL